MVKTEFNNCGKSYNRKWLFRNLNATLTQGEKWAFLGINGSGKSTLTLMLAGQVWPTEGEIKRHANDLPVSAENVHRYISLASPAMELPGEFALPELLVMHNMAKPTLDGTTADFVAELCQFDSKVMQKPLSHFSSGMLQRVKLILAVMSQTPVLILDEPLSNLDKAGTMLYNKLIAEYTANRLLVIASNRRDEYEVCEKGIEISEGGSVMVHEKLS